MGKYFGLFLVGMLLMGSQSHLQGQSLETLLERYTGKNAPGYIQPLVTAFGANLNSGLFRSAKVPKSGLHLNFSLTGMISVFSDEQKVFTATTEGLFYPEQQVETSTIVGDGKGTTVTGTGGTQFTFPGGYDLESFGLAVPTVTIGSIAGTEASLRYISTNLGEDIGKLSLLGIGVRHSISQYIPLFPLDVAAGVFYTKFDVADIIKTRLLSLHAEASRSFLLLEFYGGVALDYNSTDINYTFTALDTPTEVSVSIKESGQFRALAGVAINLLMLHANIDYSVGYQNVISAGISLGL